MTTAKAQPETHWLLCLHHCELPSDASSGCMVPACGKKPENLHETFSVPGNINPSPHGWLREVDQGSLRN
jgi:hypothetical protein